MTFDEMSEEQKAKLERCTTPEEMLQLAKDEGYQLSDDELDQIFGGWNVFVSKKAFKTQCPVCRSTRVERAADRVYRCLSCGQIF